MSFVNKNNIFGLLFESHKNIELSISRLKRLLSKITKFKSCLFPGFPQCVKYLKSAVVRTGEKRGIKEKAKITS